MNSYEKWQLKGDQKVKRHLLLCLPLIFLAIAVPALAAHGVFKVDEESLQSWFQRSGSLCVLFAVLTEYTLFQVHGLLYPTGLITEDGDILKKKYGIYFRSLTKTSHLTVLTGTFIWGFGDLLF